MLIDHMLRRDGKLKEVALGAERCENPHRATRFYQSRAWDPPQACEGPLVEGVKSTVPWSRTQEIALPREFRITMVRSVLLP